MAARRIEECTTDEQWDAAVPVLRQLWTDADESFVRSWRDEDDYRLFGLWVEGTLVGVAGVSIQRVLHHERHAWIHDFVVDETHRGEGHGDELLAFVRDWARDNDCEHVALAARLANDDAVSFYEAAGMDRWGYVLEVEP